MSAGPPTPLRSAVPPSSEISSPSPPSSPFVNGFERDANELHIPEIVKQGVLVKEGHVFRTWKSRCFELTTDGMLSYFDLKDNGGRDPQAEILGCVFLNGATVELQGIDDPSTEPTLVVHTQQAKVLLVKAPQLLRKDQAKTMTPEQRRLVTVNYLQDWYASIKDFTDRPYHPGSIVLAPYEPPLPLGEGPTLYDASLHYSLESLALSSFDVRIDPKKNQSGSFRLRTTVNVEAIAATRLNAEAVRDIREFFALRQELARWYPHRLLPPLTEFYPVRFIKRLCADATLQLAPALHDFLGLTNTYQLRDKSKIHKQLKYLQSVHEDILNSSKSKFFRSDIDPIFPDPIWPLLLQLSAQITDTQATIDRARETFGNAQSRSQTGLKRATNEMKTMLGGVSSACPALNPLLSDAQAAFDELIKIQETFNDGRFMEAGLIECSRQLETLQSLVQSRKALLIGYQLSVQTTNKEKQTLAEQLNDPELAAPKPSPRSSLAELFFSSGDLPKQIKIGEQRVGEAEKVLRGRKALLHQFSTGFGEDVRKQAQWFANDFTFLMEKYAHHQIAAHEKSIETWRKFLSMTSNFQPSATDPLGEWSHANVVGRMNTVPQTIPVGPVDLRAHASFRPILTDSERQLSASIRLASPEQQGALSPLPLQATPASPQPLASPTHEQSPSSLASTSTTALTPALATSSSSENTSFNSPHDPAASADQLPLSGFASPTVGDNPSLTTSFEPIGTQVDIAAASDSSLSSSSASSLTEEGIQSLIEELEAELDLGQRSFHEAEAAELQQALLNWRDLDVSDKCSLGNRFARCPDASMRDRCFEIYDNLLEILESDPDIVTIYPNLQAQLLYRNSVALFWKGDFAGAQASVQRLLARDPQHTKGRLLSMLIDQRNFDLSKHQIPDSPAVDQEEPGLLASVNPLARTRSSMYHKI